MNDDHRLDEALRALPTAPAAPRERMWAQIQASRAARPRPERRWRWAGAGAALAAVLVLGIAVGRWTGPDAKTTARADATAAEALTARRADGYRQAARLHFDRAEMLLAGFQAQPNSADAPAAVRTVTAAWADDLLTQTRLLLDSPAADDPDAGRLLRELELVLAEIAALPDSGSAAQAARIADGLYDRTTVQRLRLARAL
ncbi:MAG: hypothetical protein IPK64_01090 [bacterium]|nr:hypothetical protein [bacterium]